MPPFDAPAPAVRGLSATMRKTPRAYTAALPVPMIFATERAEDGERYAGLVAPLLDRRTLQFMLSAADNGGLRVEDRAFSALADGVGPEVAFAVIKRALRGP
jgi:hypothetical protein